MHAIFFDPPIENIFLGNQFAEIYKDRVYAPYLSGRTNLTIFDVGANVGLTSYYFSQFADRVYAFEPAKELYDVMVRQLEFNQIKNVIPIQMALSDREGDAIFFHQKKNRTMYSLRPAWRYENQEMENVKMIRLDTFMKENKIEKIDFMKMDVEGSEADIVCSEGFQNVGSKISTLFMEYHSWNGRHLNQIQDALKQVGFNKLEAIPNEAGLLICTRI